MQDLIGTRLSADINLGAQLAMLVGLWVGFYFARTGQIRKHRNTQTSMVLANLVFIALFMAYSFYSFVIAGGTTGGTVAILMMVHGGFGAIAEASGIYLILLMRTQWVPPRLRVRNFRLVMRSTLALWTVLVLLGVGVYYYRYLQPRAATLTAPLIQLERAGDDLVIHALELRDAAIRGNLPTTKRHAEHLVNLIEGEGGSNYGDVDNDGSLEDPGDGTGLLTYLRDVADVSKEKESADLARTVEQSVSRILLDSLAINGATDLGKVQPLARGILSLADQASGDGIVRIGAAAADEGIAPELVIEPVVPGARAEPRTVTVVMDQFQFKGAVITIREGWTVEWINKEAPRHTANADDGAFSSGTMQQGDTFAFTFNETGTFSYYCRFHGDKEGVGMAGTIVVE